MTASDLKKQKTTTPTKTYTVSGISSKVMHRRKFTNADLKTMHTTKLNFKKMKYDRLEFLHWIHNHTEGEFFLSGNALGFASEKDMLIYKLYYAN